MKRAFVTGGSGFVGRRLIPALRARNIEVRALARSDAAASAVSRAGGEVVRGDLDDEAAMTAGMRDCDVVFHAAAYVSETGKLADFLRVTVDGTKRALAAARAAGVARFVHVGTEAVLADGKPIVQADETRPLPARPAGPYPLSKGLAERAVVDANSASLATIVIRPRFVWGHGDTNLTDKIIHAVEHGKFAWVGGGHYPTSTCHVANLVEGLLAGAERGRGGEIYFVTDGEPVDFRDFLTELLAANGTVVGPRSVPRWVAKLAAGATAWMATPPVTKTAIALVGGEVTVVDAKARRELGYAGAMTRAAGLAEIRAARGASTATG